MLKKYPRMLSIMLKGFELPTNTSHLLETEQEKNNNKEIYKIPKIFDEMVKNEQYFMEKIIILICTIPFNNPTRPLVESRGTGSSANNPTAKTPTSKVIFMLKRLKCVQFLFK